LQALFGQENLKEVKMKARLFAIYILILLGGCSQLSPELQQLGTDMLGRAGVSSGQARTAFSVGQSLSQAATTLTEEEEYYLGRGVAAMVFSRYKPLNNQTVNDYISKVGAVVAAHSERPETFIGYRFTVLDTDEVNAFAAPGGFIFVTRGLLRLIPDEDALAAVLAHEVAHVVYSHGVNAIAQANITDALITIGQHATSATSSYTPAELRVLTSAFSDSVSDIFETMITKGYSRSQEYDSDTYAVNLAVKAGYNKDGLAQVLHQLEQIDGSGGWYSTHPAASGRLRNIRRISRVETSESPAQQVRKERFQRAMRSLS